MPRTRSRFLLAAVVLGLIVDASAQVASTPSSQTPRNGLIVGQVVDATTGAPIPEAVIQLSRRTPQGPPLATPRVMADEEGRFFFAELPANDFYFGVTKPGYAPAEFGQQRAWGAGQWLTLAEGERVTDVRLRMWKYGVISGRVVDEAGEPVVGIFVRALVRNVVAGRVGFGNLEVIPELVPIATTDDRGMFRLTQLQPGTYVVLVRSSHVSVPVSVMTGTDPGTLRSDLFWAGVPESGSLGQPRVQQIGDVAMLSMSSVAIPPAPIDGRQTIYPTTYYPAAATIAAAAQIPIAAGEERSDITITLQPAPSVRISGRLVTPDGSVPPPMAIHLMGKEAAGVFTRGLVQGAADHGFQTAVAISDAAGHFTLLGVPPGEYELKHGDRFLSRHLRQGRTPYWIDERLRVGAENIADVIVQARPAIHIDARVEFQGLAPGAATPRIAAIGFSAPFAGPQQFTAEVDAKTLRTFPAAAAGGQYIIQPFEPGGWVVESVKIGDKDVTDRVVDLQTDTSIVVTYTNRLTRVTGLVKNGRGEPAESVTVLVFPLDRERWSGYGTNPRRVKNVMTSRAGVYTFPHLPAGDYYLVAVNAGDAEGWQDPAKLETFARRATTLTITSGDSVKTVNLAVESR